MANIAEYLKNILSARYGKDVRQSIHDAIVEIDSVADSAQNSATQSENQAQIATEKAEQASKVAEMVYNTAIKNTASGETIHLTDSADSKVLAFGLYGKAEQNGTPTPDAPVNIEVAGESGSVVVKSVGQNLLKNTATTQTINGVTITVNEDKSITANGTATNNLFLYIVDGFNFYSNKSYKLSGCPAGGSDNGYTLRVFNRTNKSFIDYGNGVDIHNFECENAQVFIRIASGTVCNNLRFYPMIRLADTDDTYEPYTETTSTISTPDGLAGINGVCDEVVKYADGSGKRIQRISKAVFDGSSDEGWYKDGKNRWISGNLKTLAKGESINALCGSYQIKTAGQTFQQNMGISIDAGANICLYDSNHAESEVATWKENLAENNVILYYELATPIITDLTAEEIAEIEKLHTFYPATNISNDADCGMAVTYLADSKNYIDNQLAIQAQAQEEALLNMLLLMPDSVQASMIENDTNNLLNEAEV